MITENQFYPEPDKEVFFTFSYKMHGSEPSEKDRTVYSSLVDVKTMKFYRNSIKTDSLDKVVSFVKQLGEKQNKIVLDAKLVNTRFTREGLEKRIYQLTCKKIIPDFFHEIPF